MAKALQIHPADNVAVVLSDVQAEEEIVVNAELGILTIKAKNAIPFGHKVAVKEIKAHASITKYGEEIGQAQANIAVGEWIHLHNVYCQRGREE